MIKSFLFHQFPITYHKIQFTHSASTTGRKSRSPQVTLKLKSLKCLLKVMTFFCGKGFMRPNSVRLITLEGSVMGSECCFSNSTCKKIPGIQSNLSIPDPYKTEHLPKPNNFHGPDFFPYYSLLNTRAQRALGRPPEENVKGHSGAIYRGPLMLNRLQEIFTGKIFLYYCI